MISNDFFFEWFDNLQNTGKLPTMGEILTTVSSYARKNDFSWESSLARSRCRSTYVNRYSFPLITVEVSRDMGNYLDGKKVLEVCCGSGYLSKCITDTNPNVKIICSDNMSWENDGYRGWKNHFMEVEKLDALEAIDKYGDQVDYVMISWPEYESPLATKVLEKCLKKNIPLVYIGEGYYGCTADDSFFKLIDERCEMNVISNNYVPFEGLHDEIYLITEKQ